MRRHSGFTLVELLVSVVIFSAIIGTFFSVASAVRKTERFREENNTLTQAASYGFEPIIRSVKQADAVQCYNGKLVKGFYLQGEDATKINKPLNATGVLTTITIEKQQASNGPIYKAVRRDYQRENVGSSGLGKLTETTYEYTNGTNDPASDMLACTFGWGQPVTRRDLTGDQINVTDFGLRVAAPTLKETNQSANKSPFASIELTVQHRSPRAGTIAPPVTLKTTVAPTFSYGERRE